MAHIEELSTTTSLPDDHFQETLEELIGIIRPYSEDLYEVENFLDKRWLQVEENASAAKLHIFREEQIYIESIDGNIVTGKWAIIEGSNTLILEQPRSSGIDEKTLYDLAFLNEDFFILKKHGNRKNQEVQFLLLGKESMIDGMDWEEVVELIYQRYKNNKRLITWGLTLLAVIILYYIFSYA